MNEISLHVVTNFGDGTVLAPLVVFIAGWTYWCGWKSGAAVLGSSLLGAGLLITAEKLVMIGCGPAIPVFAIHSPSGHAALSAAVYGSLALVTGRQERTPTRYALYLAAAALIGLIAWSRVVLQLHTVGEVIVGLFTGGAMCVVTGTLLSPQPAGLTLRWRPAAAVGSTIMLSFQVLALFRGPPLAIEGWVHGWARILGDAFACSG
ncbi:MAG: phosphatase PAP2 family protein [Azospirillaceae bacterium]|nr:phosphatase PAP2 family protein [Azospirillaceae bacterium]